MKISKSNWLQIGLLLLVIGLLSILINNIIVNLYNTGLGFNYSWLLRPASFALAEHSLPFSPSDSYAWALFIGWLNSLKVIFASLFIATFIGFFVGIARIGTNILLNLISTGYITIIRQTPLLLQLMFWYFVGFLGLKDKAIAPLRGILSISNQGINLLGINLSAEFSALLLGLSVFTGAYIAEVVRGGINSVPRGQWEAFKSLGLSDIHGLYKIIIPQALPAIIPGLTSQYLNLAKNSTLAIAIGYADIYAVNDTIINQTGRAIECFILLLLSFLFLNIIISSLMEMVNKLILSTRINY
ncbi:MULTISPECIES: ABC transporter permease subunit [Prochlorococcus]|uniref:ABC-type amino acid transport system permease component n=1 Tax=Prochlorococcus marinus (strain SARG / CCMP1375 / SS120) TaxID=167539 RepID=Q7VCR5_PROMA|nr:MULTISPECIES: ABC transporter permease subunit [Prochlorococcus]AAP99719.1 ABC-type amino acid transport system permease component [Prochlorococcus marinus subsp. marinus str. CCMP1375]KGG13380.1 ABC transporter for amino acid [Prochlorococcus marinus str. LG]KGG24292.1 ABC transporter for amino acid [Prochlorococcus marinus str. SS35]KGG33576.1 ABC transporter for amino acid [Prochlorococcus marinus str. SS51]